jgi:hypothetical protein
MELYLYSPPCLPIADMEKIHLLLSTFTFLENLAMFSRAQCYCISFDSSNKQGLNRAVSVMEAHCVLYEVESYPITGLDRALLLQEF